MDRGRMLADRFPEQAPEKRVAQIYRAAFQRDPSSEELQSALAFVRSAEAIPTPEPPPPPPPSAWSYGFGAIKDGKTSGFSPLPHFAGKAWQGGADYPDAKLGWVKLTAEGGHAGNDRDHAAIRRWTAPVSGKVRIGGTLHHPKAEGDGIHAAIVSSRSGVIAEWNLHNQKARTEIEAVDVQKDETIDFVVDIRGGLNNDEFAWAPVIKFESEAPKSEWDARKEFSGPQEIPSEPLKPWAGLAQALLISNEFVFVD
jgi:hypothetical protein